MWYIQGHPKIIFNLYEKNLNLKHLELKVNQLPMSFSPNVAQSSYVLQYKVMF